jgi:DNA-binding XRE family transcriptional regulator
VTTTLTNIQIINDMQGSPAFAVIPYQEYLQKFQASLQPTRCFVPNIVVKGVLKHGFTPIRAWREHLGVTQADMANRLGISQSAYAQQESAERSRKVTRIKTALALGIAPEQLDF